MIKEAGIFIVSAAFLVYFISPVEEEKKTLPAQVETEQKAASAPAKNTDYWGDDEYGAGDDRQEFVFGEPMVSTDPVTDIDESSDGRNEDERETASSSTAPSKDPPARIANSRPIHSSSPKPGELGSAENPIPLN